MSPGTALADDVIGDAPPGRGRSAEGLLVAGALAVMVLLPLAEIVLRSVFHTSLWNSGTLVQHLTLLVGMAGSALAARDGRLLTLATGAWLPRTWAAKGRWFSQTVAAALAGSLTVASMQF